MGSLRWTGSARCCWALLLLLFGAAGNGNPRPDVCRGQGNPYSIRNLASFTVAGVVQQSELDHSKLAFIPARGVFCVGDIK